MNRKSTFLVFSVASAVFLGSLAWAQNIPSNVTNTVALDRLSKVLKARAVADKAEAVSLARAQGFPVRQELPGGKIIEIQRLNARGKPVYYQTDNADAADTISTDEIQVGGSTGLGLTGSGLKIGEWDGGSVKASHNELTGRITNIDSAPISDHSTHVAGTMIASGARAAARGMSTAATIDAYDFNSDTGEMAGAAAGLLLSNHSYGLITGWIFDLSTNPGGWTWFGDLAISTDEDFYFGFYDSAAQAWDQIAFDAPNYLIVKSAGNDRNDAGTTGSHVHFDLDNNLVASSDSHDADCAPAGYDCISAEGTAKNILTVGAVEDIVGGYSTATDVVMSDFSGWGPADDGRIKPDVVANGISLYSSLGGPNNKEYGYFSGTSMSAPNTTGSLLLLQEHYQDTHTGFMRSATLKALVIHTADEAGLADGPDYEHGWGLVNTESAARVITEDGGAHRIMEDVLLDGGIFSTQINVNEPYAVIKVTLVWTDPPGTPVADSLDPVDKMLVNDLDLRIYDSSGTYMPWVLDLANPASPASTGDNNTDNVEQVIVAGGTPGAYSVEVTHKGVLLSNTAQNFSLIISVEPRQQETIVFDEDFTGGLPTGWSLVNNVDSGTSSAFWEFDDLGLRDNLTGGTGRFASVDSDLAGNPSSTDAELHTASVDLSGFTQVTLSFKSDFRYYDLAPDEIADVDVSIDGGSSWSNVWQRTGGSERGPTSQTVDLTTVAAGQADVRLRFHYYNAGWDWWWQVDDVQLSGQAVNGDVCGNPYNLPANQWRLISLPCDPGASNTVNDLFSDDLTGAYNITWVMYERDEVNDQYVRLELTSRLKQGLGYWIFSTDTTLLDMTGTATPLVPSAGCSSPSGKCIEIPLENPATMGTTLYNMPGHPLPYPVNWANVRIAAAGDGASPFTPTGAATANYLSKSVYTYTGNSYAVFDDITPGYEEGAIGAWDGFWVEVLDDSNPTGNLKLLIPPERSPGVITTALFDFIEPSTATISAPGTVRWLRLLDLLVTNGVANVTHQWKKKPPGLEKREAHRKHHHAEIKTGREWYIRLIVNAPAEELRDEGNVLGQLNDSQPGYDQHDLNELSPLSPYLTIVFPHPEWEEKADDYTSDFHPVAGRGRKDTWSFEVRSNDPYRDVTLSWSSETDMSRMTLIDDTTGKQIAAINEGQPQQYRFNMGGQTVRRFEWVTGGKKAARRATGKKVIKEGRWNAEK